MCDEPMAQKMHDCGEAFPATSASCRGRPDAGPSHSVAPPRIREAPVAFECVLHEKLETESRYVFIGRVVRLAARAGLIDTEAWRVNLRDYHPVARFGASFYTRTNERFSLSDGAGQRAPTATGIDEL
jgi:flavin reductase (DIM6/NTAB) family NADH-FMN oxidoreductase RutF